jgi:hypothetical protein
VTSGQNSLGLQLTVGSLRNAILKLLPTCSILYHGDICTTSFFHLVAVASIANVSIAIIKSTTRHGKKGNYELGRTVLVRAGRSAQSLLECLSLMAKEQIAALAEQLPAGSIEQEHGGRNL